MTTTAIEPGTLEHLDPTTLVLETNVRTVVDVDPAFVDSIRQHGVLTPLLAWRADDGAVHVRAGQRRTLASREAGLTAVPVYVIQGDDDTARRIIEQLAENDQREGLTEAEHVDAWRALELEGLSVTAIAKRTGTKRDRIKTGLAVAASDTATTLVSAGLTLDQAAMLIEFEDDLQTVADLTEIAGTDPGYFPVAIQSARNERDAAALREKTEAELATKGHRILAEPPSYEESTPLRLHQVTDEGNNRITSEYVTGKPGIAAYVRAWDAERVDVTFYVDDLDAAGLILRPGMVDSASKGPMTDEQKAERKTLIANNKEWDAAETVRREWVTTFLARKTLPKDATTVVATILATGRFTLGDSISHGNSMAKTVLGIDSTGIDALGEYLTAHPNRALHVAVAVAFGGIEQQTSRNTWRNPRTETATYLQIIHSWGYPLSPVERIAAMLVTESEEAE